MVINGYNPTGMKEALSVQHWLTAWPFAVTLSVLPMPNTWSCPGHSVSLDLAVHPHESWTHPYNQLRWQWKPHAIPAALLVTLLSQVHPNTQKLRLSQGLNSDAAALYRWACCISAPPTLLSKHSLIYGEVSHQALQSHHRAPSSK